MNLRLLLALILPIVLVGRPALAVEEPAYRTILHEGAFEVREYPPLVAAEVTVTGDRDEAVNAGFRLLAGYIFGGNQPHQSIAMTAPVVQARARGEAIPMTAPVVQTATGNAWVVRFIMPHAYSLATLPRPDNPKVRLVPLAPARVAVVRFSGLTGEAAITRQTTALRGFIEARGLHAVGEPSLARYDPPWTPWFARRNEVSIPLASD